jgi:hypothetical protein
LLAYPESISQKHQKMLEKAIQYVLDLLTEGKEVKKLPPDFVGEAVLWAQSWFLKPDDPKTTAKLLDPHKSIEVKKDLIQNRWAELQDNAQFQQELAARLAALAQQRARLKNVVTDSEGEVQGSVRIGDQGRTSGDDYDEKNIIKGSTIKAGGDFRLGDDVGNRPGPWPASQKPGTPPLKTLLAAGKTAEVIAHLLAHPSHDPEADNKIVLLSARLSRVEGQVHQGLISHAEADRERNQINAAIIHLLDGLGA